jgi:hypothetical protein
MSVRRFVVKKRSKRNNVSQKSRRLEEGARETMSVRRVAVKRRSKRNNVLSVRRVADSSL